MRPLKKEELVAGREYCAATLSDFRRVRYDGEDFYEITTDDVNPFHYYKAVYPLPADVLRPTRGGCN